MYGDCLIVPEDVLRITKSDHVPGLIIAGEIDESTYPCLVQALATVGGYGDVHVDLSAVEFCDLAGLRAIVTLADPERDGDRAQRVILHAMPARLQRVLQILGWDTLPGLTFDAEPIAGPAVSA